MSAISEPVAAQPGVDAAPSPPRALSPINEHDDVVFHGDWDLIMKVTGESGDRRFKVIAANVACASPIWRKIVYGDSAMERPAIGDWILDFDDSAKALEILLRIVHYGFNKVPMAPSLDDLYEITRLTSKYRCTHLVFPWAAKWVGPFANFDLHQDAPRKNHKAAWIAWEFGAVKLFENMADSMIATSSVDEDGHLVNQAGIRLQDLVLPAGLLDRIITTRSETISKMLAKVQEPIDHTTGVKRNNDAKYCQIGTDVPKCEAMLLGSCLPKLIRAGLFPVPDAKNYKHSIGNLKLQAFDLVTFHWEGRNHLPHKSHTNCDLGFGKAIMKVLCEMAIPLDCDHYEHLFKQAEIVGLVNDIELASFKKKLCPTAKSFKPNAETESVNESIKAEDDDVKSHGSRKEEDGVKGEKDSASGSPKGSDTSAVAKEERGPDEA
ncbi:hypothetical protein BJ170DRAFT_593369 [Xylariales sp. AK1849]|nr:hypothetical protein BJ170DRAFT_593369 [Xylariales sp. AK1849]